MEKSLKDIQFMGTLTIGNVVIEQIYTTNIGIGDTAVTIDWANGQIQQLVLTGSDPVVTITFTGGSELFATPYRLYVVHADVDDKTIDFPANQMEGEISTTDTKIEPTVPKMLYLTFDGTYYHWINRSRDVLPTGTYTEDNEYSSNVVIADGDAYNTAFTKLDNAVGKLIPTIENAITTATVIPNTAIYELIRSSDAVGGMHVSFLESTQFGLDKNVNDPHEGNVALLLNIDEIASLPLTTNDDTDITDASLKILSNEQVNSFQSELELRGIITRTNAPIGETAYTVEFTLTVNGDKSQPYVFYNDLILSDAQPTLALLDTTFTLTKVSGVPMLKANDNVQIDAQINNCIGYFRGTQIAKVSSLATDETVIEIGTSETFTNGDAYPFTKQVTIAPDKFVTDLSFDVVGIRPDGTETTPTTGIKKSNRLMVDSITDRAYVGYDHDTSLLSNQQIMLMNGKFQYPTGNYSDVDDGLGGTLPLDYTTITDDRYLIKTFSITNKGLIIVDFVDTENFGTTEIESDATYALEMRIGGGAWLDGNKAYGGVGEATDGCLDISASTAIKKVMTFGIVKTGVVDVRITLKNGSTKKFGQATTITEGNS